MAEGISPAEQRHGADAGHGDVARPTESQRDPVMLRDRLGVWLQEVQGADAVIEDLQIPSANGMSSETLLFDARWSGQVHRLVARVAPLAESDPVFATYDLDRQYAVMRRVSETTEVPVPTLFWSEPDPGPLGSPFFVMARIDGVIPPDVMPYTFGSWVTEASDDDRAVLERSAVETIAAIHATPVDGDLLEAPAEGETPLRAHVRRLRTFYEWACDGHPRSPLIERAFRWIDDNVPVESDPALSWGDARIGNIVFGEFRPVAVLDWEMACLGPRELDLGWAIFLHRFFQDITEMAGLPGLPDFLRPARVTEIYREATGYEVRDLDFYITYASIIHAVIMYRIQIRAITFGHATVPDDPDDMIMHRATVDALIAGTYWTDKNLGSSGS
ncbi:phosphotransferase family protein [Williamsia phyllosphaerae]|uniref:Phosphotransferase n=1 Tax=Williamsia phyllosphaerae TaxID=885042 RepID=A0ABQ1V324_9NOCA|nr:phosphotransferase family protein [Williamsia phyllosphaerae]GGF32902.1 putative phosphotransferase [Williamsia phyllosphaerae]